MDQDKYKIIRVLVILICMHFLLYWKMEFIEKPQKSAMHYSYTQTRKNLDSFGKCDTAGGYVYFTYRSNKTLITVYDFDGNYLQTIEFNDFDNGDVSLRREQDQMILRLRNDNVFIIQGKEVISGMTKAEAEIIGYTNDWFRNAEKHYEVTEDAIHVHDEEGNVCVFRLSKARKTYNRVVRRCIGVAVLIVAVCIKKFICKKT